jgi:hypothetical protein
MRRHRNPLVNDTIAVLDAAASCAIRCAAPVAAITVIAVLSVPMLAWGAYCAIRRGKPIEPGVCPDCGVKPGSLHVPGCIFDDEVAW